MTDPTSTETRQNLMIRSWRGFVRTLLTPVQTYVGGLLLAGIVIFAGGAFLFDRQADSDTRSREAALDRRDLDAFLIADDKWRDEVKAYNACVLSVEQLVDSNTGIRTVLFSFADLTDILPGNEQGAVYTANRRQLVDTLYPAVDLEQRLTERCEPIAPGTQPVDPRTD